MPQGPKGLGWGLRTVFGKPKVPAGRRSGKGGGCSLWALAIISTAGAAALSTGYGIAQALT